MSSRPDSDTPFRILVLGDFGASAASAKPVVVDRDNFESVMARLDVGLELPGAGRLRFKELDDFHPDRLFESLDLFHGLREMRERIEDPETFRQAASELMEPAREPKPASPIDFLSSGSLLDDLVESSGPSPVRRSDPFQKYLQAIVAPHIVPQPDPKKGEMLQQVDAAIAAHMRALLPDPHFPALAAAPRALLLLARHAET